MSSPSQTAPRQETLSLARAAEGPTRRCSEREPAVSLGDKTSVIGGWLPSLTFALGVSRMRQSFFILIAILSVCSGCGPQPQFRLHKSDELGTSSQGTIIAETWLAPLSCPIWKVCLRQKDSTNSVVLFTVASVFQESEPGYPHLVVTNDTEIIQDSARSYIFSLASRSFITNVWSGSTYLGDFRPDKPRD